MILFPIFPRFSGCYTLCVNFLTRHLITCPYNSSKPTNPFIVENIHSFQPHLWRLTDTETLWPYVNNVLSKARHKCCKLCILPKVAEFTSNVQWVQLANIELKGPTWFEMTRTLFTNKNFRNFYFTLFIPMPKGESDTHGENPLF